MKIPTYVYKLRSLKTNEIYTGITHSPRERLAYHNAGQSTHTSKNRPWKMEVCVWFNNERKALAFEKYLKSGSGRAFSSKRF
jgi:predicted GIY-YIG superfamily endonuclease